MTNVKLFLIGVILMFVNTTPLAAQSDNAVFSDPVPCILATHALDEVYRGVLQSQCLALAGDYCAKSPDAGACLVALNTNIRTLYSEVSNSLPTAIDGTPAFAQDIEKAAEVFNDNPECSGSQGIALEACSLKNYSTQIIVILGYAAQSRSWP